MFKLGVPILSMWPSKININQKDGVLSESATQDEILNALILWEMPLGAYPKEILSAKLVWYIPQPGADDITVDLLLQAFVVPHIDWNYYSFWNKDEFPLGHFTLCKNKMGKYIKGYNHTSALQAWEHAKQILQEQYPMDFHWLTFQGVSQPINHNKVPGKSSPADINKKCYDGKTIDVVGVEMQQQQQQSSQASAALHQADAAAAAAISSSSSSSSNGNLQLDQNVGAECSKLCKDMETRMWDAYQDMNSSILGLDWMLTNTSTNDWVLVQPRTFTDVWFDDAEDGQHHKVEPDGHDGEPQAAQDGQPHNMDPMIEVASASSPASSHLG